MRGRVATWAEGPPASRRSCAKASSRALPRRARRSVERHARKLLPHGFTWAPHGQRAGPVGSSRDNRRRRASRNGTVGKASDSSTGNTLSHMLAPGSPWDRNRACTGAGRRGRSRFRASASTAAAARCCHPRGRLARTPDVFSGGKGFGAARPSASAVHVRHTKPHDKRECWHACTAARVGDTAGAALGEAAGGAPGTQRRPSGEKRDCARASTETPPAG